MGFWIGILIMVAIVVGASVLVGMTLNKRRGRSPRQQRQLDMAKAAGAFPNRKESH